MRFLRAGAIARPEGGGGGGGGQTRGLQHSAPPSSRCLPAQGWVGPASPFQADLTQSSKVPLRSFPDNPKDLQSRKPKESFINKSIYLKEYVTINYTK